MRRSRQSDLASTPTEFRPREAWSRLSFLDLMGEGRNTPITELEPAYIDGSTVVAVWPPGKDYERVTVMLWAPDRDVMQRLHRLQVDWPAATCDVRVRANEAGRVDIEPCLRGLARSAVRSETDLAIRVRNLLERGSMALGRTINLAP